MEKKVVVIAGPSGSGKNTLIRSILSRYPRAASLTTATTRTARPNEIDGSDYYFFSIDRFDAESANIAGQRFVPLFGGVHYGIYIPDLTKKMESASVVFAAVDITGARWLKEHHNALTIFLEPESVEQYRSRVRARSPEMNHREFDMRMRIMDEELHAHAPEYDYRVTAADGGLDEAVEQVLEILKKEGYTLS